MDIKDKIYERFGFMFRRPHMGLEVGDGWLQIIYDLLVAIEPVVHDDSSFKVMQIKQKFGDLRFYSTHDEKLHSLISIAEKKASETCEMCGEKGYHRDGMWMAVRCDLHANPR